MAEHELAKFLGEVVRDYPKIVSYFIGILICSIGVWALCSFGWGLVTLGAGFIMAAIGKALISC